MAPGPCVQVGSGRWFLWMDHSVIPHTSSARRGIEIPPPGTCLCKGTGAVLEVTMPSHFGRPKAGARILLCFQAKNTQKLETDSGQRLMWF